MSNWKPGSELKIYIFVVLVKYLLLLISTKKYYFNSGQVYRSILVNRLVTARQMQKLDDEFETQLDNWDENVTDTEVDQLVDALALAHSINNQLSPFSSLH